MPNRCTVCMHPERVAIDRSIATGTASFRTVAKTYDLTPWAVRRHVVNHLEPTASNTPAAVAHEVVQAVREQQQRERQHLNSVWVQRLDKTYTDTASACVRALSQPDGLDAAAKFLMVQARLCDTGLRTDGVLAGGGETRVTVNVEQLIVLPTPQPQPKRLEVTEVIDVTPTE